MPLILKTVAEVRAFQATHKKQTLTLVPTMGNLHAGHVSLMEAAKQRTDQVIVSVFVNPTQFAAHEDLGAYPRTFTADLDKMRTAGVDAVFFPDVATMYPFGLESAPRIEMADLMPMLCGKARPTHFQGVASVVLKLFTLLRPDVAIFGQKDYQQYLLIKRLVGEFFLPIDVIGMPIVRETDGLAMSSRNGYLTTEERVLAPQFAQVLTGLVEQLQSLKNQRKVIEQSEEEGEKEGAQRLANCLSNAIENLSQRGLPVDYLELRDAENLMSITQINQLANARLIAAVYLGKARLLDNMAV